MRDPQFPPLDPELIGPTRDALHAYARVIGNWAEGNRQRRKHWWHISLRPSLCGLTTGVIHANINFELELDFRGSALRVSHDNGTGSVNLCGQSARELARFVNRQLELAGIEDCRVPDSAELDDTPHPEYSAQLARDLHVVLASVTASLDRFRATIREETSPIQVWPHHFDLAMVWLPGTRVVGADPADEETADKQMNFGFLFGDSFIAEPYLYVTAYPHPQDLQETELPAGTEWYVDGFKGAVLKYSELARQDQPADYLHALWDRLLTAAREHLCT